MLDCGDGIAVIADGGRQGRITDIGNIRFYAAAAIAVSADKGDAFVDAGGLDGHADPLARMQTDAFTFYFFVYGMLQRHYIFTSVNFINDDGKNGFGGSKSNIYTIITIFAALFL
jgi:hypothetical protein